MPRGQTRSIGEVLALLKTEFSDISISKIRFLESQGLVNPERTASGYRKFSDDDLAQLRYILRQQKEHFLPLKVIKGRLTDRANGAAVEGATMTSLESAGAEDDISVMLNRDEMLAATDLTESQARELEGFGVIAGEQSGSGVWYGNEAVMLGKLASRFLSFGVEARHLRIFKTGAEREADLYKQMVGGGRGHRNTQARMEAAAKLEEFTKIGESMHAELLKQALRNA